MAGAIGGLLGGSVMNIALNMVSKIFPPMALASSVANMVTKAVGQAVTDAAQQLVKESGMPKFLENMVGKVVKEAVQSLLKPSDSEADAAASEGVGKDVKDFMKDLTDTIVKNAQAIMEQDKGDGKSGKSKEGSKKSATSWLEAIALAMGEAAGNKAAKMVELSNKLKELSSAGGGEEAQAKAAKEMNAVNAQFQATSQEFNMLQSAFSNAIKAIGEGMAQMARKG